jgi:hypothetical protein
MVYVRRVIATLLIVMGLLSVHLLVKHWSDLDSRGGRVLFAYLAFVIAFLGSGVAILWPVKPSVSSRKAAVGVYVRRVLAVLFIAAGLTFALRIPGSVGRKTKSGGSRVTSDIVMVVLFTGLTTAVLFPTRREKPRTDAATS